MWSYFVCEPLRSINVKLDEQLQDIFSRAGIGGLSREELEVILEKYLEDMKKKDD